MRKYLFISIILLLILNTLPITMAQPIQWQAYSPQAFDLAKTKHRLVLVEVYTDWCHWCKKMKNTYSDPRVVNIINQHFIPVKLDADKNIQITKQFKVINLPAALILDSNYNVMNTINGYYTADEFIAKLNEIIGQ